MRVSAKADYAVRAAAELAAAEEGPIKGERLAEAQDIPLQFLEHILLELKHQGIVRARRGAKGGYWLARPADEVTIADIVRAVEGPIADVQSTPPEAIEYRGNAEPLQKVWIAVRASLRTVLENVTLADLVSGDLPPVVDELIASPDAWVASTGTKEMVDETRLACPGRHQVEVGAQPQLAVALHPVVVDAVGLALHPRLEVEVLGGARSSRSSRRRVLVS